MVELFWVTTKELKVYTVLVPYAVLSFSLLFFRPHGDVEALMGLISSFRNLGTGLNPDCYFRHSKKVIPNFDLMTAFKSIFFKLATSREKG